MITIRPMRPDESATLRGMRLRALSDTPLAFGSTFAKESAFTDQDWRDRAQQWNGPESSRMFFAFDGESCCGIIGC